jgi:hypothetical protein
MQLEVLSNVIWTATSIILLIAAYMFVFRPMMADVFRDRLAKIRDEVLAFAEAGHISREHPAVQRICDTAEGLAAAADDLTLVRFMLVTSTYRRMKVGRGTASNEQVLESVKSSSARRRLAGFQRDIGSELARHLFLGSFMGSVILVVMFPIYVIDTRLLGRVRDANRLFQRMATKLMLTGNFDALERELVPVRHGACA